MTASDIIALVNSHPHGLTTAQAAEITGMKPGTIATRLSKLADYGKINRTRDRSGNGNNASRWLPKIEAPP